MKAHEPVHLDKILDEAVEEAWKHAQETTRTLEQSRRYADLFRRVGYFYKSRVFAFNPPILQLYVDNIKDVEPALRLIEDECKVVFDRTDDSVSAHIKERRFRAKDLGFHLDVEISADSPTCRSVLVGYEQIPKYELRCDEEGEQA